MCNCLVHTVYYSVQYTASPYSFQTLFRKLFRTLYTIESIAPDNWTRYSQAEHQAASYRKN